MYPLDATWIPHPLTLEVDGTAVTAVGRANWGAAEVELTSPVAHVSRRHDGRAWSFALLAAHRPESRYAFQGRLTPRGVEAVRRLATDLYRDWSAVRRHGSAVESACRRARRGLADLDREAMHRRRPALLKRLELRAAFRAGRVGQADHQRQRHEIRQRLEEIDSWRGEAGRAVKAAFVVWMEGNVRCMTLEEAERLLCEGASPQN